MICKTLYLISKMCVPNLTCLGILVEEKNKVIIFKEKELISSTVLDKKFVERVRHNELIIWNI